MNHLALMPGHGAVNQAVAFRCHWPSGNKHQLDMEKGSADANQLVPPCSKIGQSLTPGRSSQTGSSLSFFFFVPQVESQSLP